MNRRGSNGGPFGTPTRSESNVNGASPIRAISAHTGGASATTFLYIVLVGIFLVWQAMRQIPGSSSSFGSVSLESLLDPSFMPAAVGGTRGGGGMGWNAANPLDIPQGEAPSLPTTTSSSSSGADVKSSSQPLPLLDWQSLSPSVWKRMISDYGIHSIIDVGCGQLGATTAWFQTHGVKTLCVDAMPPSLEKSKLLISTKKADAAAGDADALRIVQHDYTRGPWWPKDTYDAAWAVEFLEHVPLEHQFNYISTFRKAALVFVTSSQSGGGNTGPPGRQTQQKHNLYRAHVEVHDDDWWIQKMELYGFRYSEKLTKQVRKWAMDEKNDKIPRPAIVAAGATFYDARHVWLSIKIFMNPTVAALPQHAHLFFEHGCHGSSPSSGPGDLQQQHRPCGTGTNQEVGEVAAAKHLLPLELTAAMDKEWNNRMAALVQGGTVTMTAAPGGPVPAANKEEDANNDEAALAAAAEAGMAPRPAPPAAGVIPLNEAIPEIVQRIRDANFTNLPIIPVVAWPYVEYGVKSAEHKHIEENGINESSYLRLSMDIYDPDPNMVWIGDTGWGFGWAKWCQEYLKIIKKATDKRKEQNLPTKWPVYIVDFTDHAGFQRCTQIEEFMGRDLVKYTTRSLAKGRKWQKAQQWVKFGSEINRTLEDGTFYKHTPLIVRTDTIESLSTVLAARGYNLSSPLERLDRPTDVTHLWPIDLKGVNPIYSELRLEVSKIVDQLGKDHNLNNFVGLKGEAIRTGRRGVKNEYIEALVDTKIMIVTQRDDWEDHYRLMEALISGACVFTDFMYGLPAGLQNGTSVVMFTSAQDLKNQILYYLAHDEERVAIGREGRYVAMTRHRTWHRIEEIIFDQIMSTCEAAAAKNNATACPWVVHGNELRRRRRRQR